MDDYLTAIRDVGQRIERAAKSPPVEKPKLPIELYAVSWNHMVSRLGPTVPGRTWVRATPEVRAVTEADRWRLYLPRATYSSLADFGPLKLRRELPVYLAAIALALGLERLIRARRPSPAAPGSSST